MAPLDLENLPSACDHVQASFQFSPEVGFDGEDVCPSAEITVATGNDAAKIHHLKVTITKLTHTWGSDVNLVLKKDGVPVILIGQNGVGNDENGVQPPGTAIAQVGGAAWPSELPGFSISLENLIFSDKAAESTEDIPNVASGGEYRPWQPLSALKGLPVDGVYTLEICDSYAAVDQGIIYGYNLEIVWEKERFTYRPETTVEQNGSEVSILELANYRSMYDVDVKASTKKLNEARFAVNANVEIRDVDDINGALQHVENRNNIIQFGIDRETFLNKILYKRNYDVTTDGAVPTGDEEESDRLAPADDTAPFQEIVFTPDECAFEFLMMDTVKEQIYVKMTDMITLEPEKKSDDNDLKALYYAYEENNVAGNDGLHGLPSANAKLVSKYNKDVPTKKIDISNAWEKLYEDEQDLVKLQGNDLGENQVFDETLDQVGLLGRENQMTFTVSVYDGRSHPTSLGGGKTCKNMFFSIEAENSGKVALSAQFLDGAVQGMSMNSNIEMNQVKSFETKWTGNDGGVYQLNGTDSKAVGHKRTRMPDASTLKLSSDALHTVADKFTTIVGTVNWTQEPAVTAKISASAVSSFIHQYTKVPDMNLNDGVGSENWLKAIKDELRPQMGANRLVKGFYGAPGTGRSITTTLPYSGAVDHNGLMNSKTRNITITSGSFISLLAIKEECD